MQQQYFDFIVVGAGLSGVATAAELSRHARVALVEREAQPGYHATGRSAALFSELYGNPTVRALTRASRRFYFDPPPGFSQHPLVAPRETMYFAGPGEQAQMEAMRRTLQAESGLLQLDAATARQRVPVFRDGYLSGALLETGSADIDVAGVLQGYRVLGKARGVEEFLGHPVERLQRDGDQWRVQLRQGDANRTLAAPVLVNAAGAWGDAVAQLAGVSPLGLVPKRRTVVLIDVPGEHVIASWPAAIHVGESFYFKPDAGTLLLSPADETPSEPCDAQPDEYDIALAVDRFEQCTGLSVRRLRSRWAGLRSFVADKTPAVGYDAVAPGFFWLVGQGGYGIQSAPALSRTAAALAAGQPVPADIAEQGVRAEDLSPARRSLAAATAT